jgi:minor histocompatibility antigen H13
MTGQSRHVMLGLGDIVVPGIFIALCLQFDYDQAEKRLSKKSLGDLTSIAKPYFKSCLMAYMLGLMLTITMMHVFRAAQPALLYLSPACILSSIICACWRGELATILRYTTDHSGKSKASPITSTS